MTTTLTFPINTQALLNEATQLQQQLNRALLSISTQSSHAQLESIAKLPQLNQLEMLQKKMERFFALMDTFDGEECVQISEKLSESVQLKDKLSDAQNNALTCGDLFTEVQEALRSKQNDTLNSLNARITREISSRAYNQGIQKELLNLQSNLREAISGNSALFQQIQPVVIIPSHSVHQKAEELCEKYQKISQEWNSDLNQAFPLFLPFFKELQILSQQNLEISEDRRFKELYESVSKLLQKAIIAQVETEKAEEMRRIEVTTSNGQNFVTALKEIEKKMGSKGFDPMSTKKILDEAFNKLSPVEKQKFKDELAKVTERRIIDKYLTAEIQLWPGSLVQKLQAAEKAFPTIIQSAQSALKKSEQMKREWDEVRNLRVEPQQALASINNDHSGNNLEIRGILIKAIDELQKCTHFLQKGHPEDLGSANQILKSIADNKLMCVFMISGQEAIAIAQRPHFHLYQIHRNESPSLLKDDANYGSKAFEGMEGFPASHAERMRSLQRTLVEVALSGLDHAIHFGDNTGVEIFLSELDKLQLQNIDLQPRTLNLAHAIYSTFYTLHVEARRSKPLLIDPHHPQFNGDFSRNAFKLSMIGIDNSVKLRAIDQVRDALKATWKI
jgi:hypothetical protein